MTRGECEQPYTAPVEAIALRSIGTAWLAAVVVVTFVTDPRPGLHGNGLLVLLGFALMVGSSIASQPYWDGPPGEKPLDGERRMVLSLLGVTAGAVILALVQPHGIWLAGPYFVAIMAATRLSRRSGAIVLAIGITPFTVGALVAGDVNTAISTSVGVVPWYLILRLMRLLGERNRALDMSRAAEAEAAVVAERARIAREMHDVLAHSLSALALQLESTRLLARDRDVNPEVARAIDQAHSLAAGGLDDARRAIAAARGDELPGPERLEALAGAFGDQSGLPVAIEIRGQPRELPPDARLAVYRTAQEALTNVRRHAAAARVNLSLDYQTDSTVLVVEDQGLRGHRRRQPPGWPAAAMG